MNNSYQQNAKTPSGPISATPAKANWGGFRGLLKKYAGAAAGYSLRKIGSGPVVRLRRASDNEEKDFAAGDLTGSVEGAELLTNGDFSNGSTGWNLTGWTVTGGQAVADASGSLELLDQHVLDDQQAGDYIKVTFDIVACSDFAQCGIQINSTGLTRFDTILQINSPGTYSFLYYYDTKVNNRFRFYAQNSAGLTIDNVSVVPYTPTTADIWAMNGRLGYQGQNSESAYATTWYDQSGSGNDATQTTSTAQPLLIRAGVTNTDNGKPALSFDGVDDWFVVPEIALAENSFFGCVRTSPDIASGFRVIAGRFLSNYIRISNGGGLDVNSSGTSVSTVNGVFSDDEQALISFVFAGGQWQTNKNGLSVGSGAETQSTLFVRRIGQANDLWYWDSNMQEIIFYPSDQSTNRIGIETNINDHYGIY
jgi:hypothetical protein